MSRILIDTDELRSLGGLYAEGAGSLSNMQSQLASTLRATRLNEADPGIRAARIADREHALDGQLARIADEYSSDGHHFGELARRAEAEESGGGSWLHLGGSRNWAAIGATVGLGAGAGSVVAGLVGLAVPEGILAEMRRLGLSAIEATRETVARGVEVGRSALDAGLGLVTSAAHGFSQAANWLGDRIRHLVEGAWDAIWDGINQALSQAMASLRSLRRQVATPSVQVVLAPDGGGALDYQSLLQSLSDGGLATFDPVFTPDGGGALDYQSLLQSLNDGGIAIADSPIGPPSGPSVGYKFTHISNGLYGKVDLVRTATDPTLRYIIMGTKGFVLMKAGSVLDDSGMLFHGRAIFANANRWQYAEESGSAMWVLGPALDLTEAGFAYNDYGLNSEQFIEPAGRAALTLGAVATAEALVAAGVVVVPAGAAVAAPVALAVSAGLLTGAALNWGSQELTGKSVSGWWVSGTHNEHLRIQIDEKNANGEELTAEEQEYLRHAGGTMEELGGLFDLQIFHSLPSPSFFWFGH